MYYATGLPGWMRAGYAPDWGAYGGGPYQALSPEQEADMLKKQAQALNDQIAAINERITELEKK